MDCNYLDCSNEVSSMRRSPGGRLCWLAPELSRDDYRVTLPDAARDEIDLMARHFDDNPLPVLCRKLDEFELPACRAIMAQMKRILDDGVGFAVLDRLPMDDYPVDTMLAVYWVPMWI